MLDLAKIKPLEEKEMLKIREKEENADVVFITEDEQMILFDMNFEENDDINPAFEMIFGKDLSARLFNENVVVICGKIKYHYYFDNEKGKCKHYITEGDNLISNAEFCYVTKTFNIEESMPTGYENAIQIGKQTIEMFRKAKLQINPIKLYHNLIYDQGAEYWVESFKVIIGIAKYVLSHKNIIEIDNDIDEGEPAEVIKDKNTTSLPRVSGNINTNVYSLSEVVYRYKRKMKKQNKQYTYTKEKWGVRGHWRKYKSGKRVWVEAFQKGAAISGVSETTVPEVYKL